jgi:hypothetical protein
VRELKRKLWLGAKRSPGRRFHALFDRIYSSDVLKEGWRRVQKNKGAAGVDSETLKAAQDYGSERLSAGLQRDLRKGSFRPPGARHPPRLPPALVLSSGDEAVAPANQGAGSSESRVGEIRTHGLKGEWGNGPSWHCVPDYQ